MAYIDVICTYGRDLADREGLNTLKINFMPQSLNAFDWGGMPKSNNKKQQYYGIKIYYYVVYLLILMKERDSGESIGYYTLVYGHTQRDE